MRKILDLRLAYIITAVAVLPLIAAIGFSIMLITKETDTVSASDGVARLTSMSVALSNVVHEMQKERGASAVFMGSRGSSFRNELKAQRVETDAKIASLNEFLSNLDQAYYGSDFVAELDEVRSGIAKIGQIRSGVTALSIPQSEAIGYYTGSNGHVLDFIGSMSSLSPDPFVSTQFIAYENYLKSKERAGIERAVGSVQFSAGQFSSAGLNKFNSLITQQNVYADVFRRYATASQIEMFDAVMSAPAAVDVQQMRGIANSTGLAGDLQGTSVDVWFATITQKINGLKTVEDRMAGDLHALMGTISARAESKLWTVTAIALITVALSIIVSILIVRALTGKLTDVAHLMNDLSSGNLEVDIPPASENEIGEMVKAIQVFKDNAVERVRLEAEQAKEAEAKDAEATRILNVADRLKSALASSMENVDESIDSMGQTAVLLQDAAGAGHKCAGTAAEATGAAASNVETVASAAEELGASIEEISVQTSRSQQITTQALDMSQQAAENMAGLASKADSVGAIVELINDIAAQTNLLALNATIEAARAGEAGKGFAVVASEVKALANQTANATSQITGQIQALQEASSSGSKTVDEIGNIVREVSENVTSISVAMEEQTAATREISRSAQEASRSTSEVDASVAEVTTAAGKTDKASDEIQTSSANLAKQTNELKTQVGKLLQELTSAA